MHSCIYEGQVTHRRNEPITHQFQNRLFMVYLDLDELPTLVGSRAMISGRKLAGRSFLRSDHLFDSEQSLNDEIRDLVLAQTGSSPRGPIRLLTQLRYCGYYFSPLNMFYVFDQHDEQVEFVVAEVSNTPWNERHCYTLWHGNRTDTHQSLQFSHRKDFHVSPFMEMEMEYRWKLSQPGNELKIGLANLRDETEIFSAGMTLRRRDLNHQQLTRMTLRYPFMTAQIGAAIYFQALKLWWKKCPFYTHPKKRSAPLDQTRSNIVSPTASEPSQEQTANSVR